MSVHRALFGVVGIGLWVAACSGETFTAAQGGAGGQSSGGSDNTDAAGGSSAGSGGSLAGSGGNQAGSGGSQAGSGGAHAGAGGSQAGSGGSGGGCEDEVAPTGAIYVSADLGNDSAPGTSQQPLATLAAAIAVGDGKVIVLAQGEYTEGPLQLNAGGAITVRGGYVARADGEWRRSCNDFPTRTKVSLPQGIGFDSSGGLTLDTLAFTQRAPQGNSGKASVGLFVRAGSLRADNVAVSAAIGSSGDAPSAGTPGAPGSAQLSQCGDGNEGTAGPAGSQQVPWSINAAGYVAGSGQTGQPGTKGHAGGPGQAAVSRSDCKACHCSNACVATNTTVSAGAATCGDGGEPGGPGSGGLGGGASIALFLAPGVSVSLARVTLAADHGGPGSSGAQGGDGGAGVAGAQGSNSGACCRAGCAIEGNGQCGSGGCYAQPYEGGGVVGACPADRVVATTAGGKGGRGGNGGRGADGPPGPAFALVHAQADALDLSQSVSLLFASGAADANNGAIFAY